MGGRSQRACEMLAAEGYTDLANMVGGFNGSPDQPGWVALGLPTATKAAAERTYDSLSG